MAKGNRTKDNRNTDTIEEYNSRYKEEIDGYKRFAEARRNNRSFTQEQVTFYYNAIKDYFNAKDKEKKPYTISGIMLSLNFNEMTFNRMKSGEYDYRLYEFMDRHSISENDFLYDDEHLPYVLIDDSKVLLIPYSTLVEKAYLLLQEQIEERLYEKGRVGDIFSLKAKHGWSDSGDDPHTVNQTLVIASPEQAREALRLLK